MDKAAAPFHSLPMADDAMVPIAWILGRGEMLAVAAMLDAAGIIVHVGGEHYASVSPEVLAIGGFRLTVPAWQYGDASAVLSEMLAARAPEPNGHAARALGRFALAAAGALALFSLPSLLVFGLKPLLAILSAPLLLLQVPVNMDGRSEYHLRAAPLPTCALNQPRSRPFWFSCPSST
ncbi:Uncharacterized protein SGRAN_0269 [Sphingopyxis granuli]|uniref:Uncharacterized protein n=2 Tax=Sphingopyxis granuli TaxID=267128 RepID=A0AA86L0Y2_9SPHN|nr:Uncharacterized protein SGRAN_0269 [Sphingopyxis granuli]